MQRIPNWLSVSLLVVGGLVWQTISPAAEPHQLSAQSPSHSVALLELYTSEGCNSCPAADTWVSSLSKRGFRSDRVIPLALHVDYWDYLGWPDRFAQAIFTQRQRAIATQHRSRTIYTPQLVLHGKDLRDRHTFEQQLQQINDTSAQAQINLRVTPNLPTALEVVAQAAVPEATRRPHAVLYMALYENNLQSDVTAGENDGRTLHHEFVVRQWIGPVPLDTQGNVRVQRRLRLEPDWKSQNLGIVAFVQNRQTSDVLQALALPLANRP